MANLINVLFGTKTRTLNGPRIRLGQGSPQGNGQFGGCSPIENERNSESAENGYMKYTIHIHTDSILPRQYPDVVRLQTAIGIYVRKAI